MCSGQARTRSADASGLASTHCRRADTWSAWPRTFTRQSIEPESKLFFYYMPALQWKPQDGGLFVRARGGASAIAEPLRRALQREMPGTSFVTVKPMGDIVGAKMRSWIVGATLFTAFGVLALVLAAVGLYSVIAYNVTQRKHELGVRLALGAGRMRVVRVVVMESVRFALAGVVIGSVVALRGGEFDRPAAVQPVSARPGGVRVGGCGAHRGGDRRELDPGAACCQARSQDCAPGRLEGGLEERPATDRPTCSPGRR